jgi:dethiobiotin synthetase
MNTAYFLTGTDTDVGKTFITCALLRRGAQRGLRAAGVKPVAAGTDADGRNEDIEAIRAASSVALPPAIINSYCFRDFVAPHIAAAQKGVVIDLDAIVTACRTAQEATDLLIVEGVGGFRVPLGVDRDSADLAVALGLPVILVVGLRLGCINQALLAGEAIARRSLELAGWVANCIDPAMTHQDENIEALASRLAGPLLGVVPHVPGSDPGLAAGHLVLPSVPGI